MEDLYLKMITDYKESKVEHNKFVADCQGQQEKIESYGRIKQPNLGFIRTNQT